jgi:sugar phosphate permease
VANWFGKGKKGLIFGIWNSHTSIGNILGSLLAGAFVEDSWGLSFIVPGISISVTGVVVWLFLVPRPEDVDLEANEDGAQVNTHLGFSRAALANCFGRFVLYRKARFWMIQLLTTRSLVGRANSPPCFNPMRWLDLIARCF